MGPKFQDFQVPDFQKSGLGRAWALGRAGPLGWASLPLGSLGFPRLGWEVLRVGRGAFGWALGWALGYVCNVNAVR